MPRDFLAGTADHYDCVVIGGGLAGLTSANILGRAGHRVLLLEQHYKLGGLATWFRRPGGHIFDISLHGFPHGMLKSCRRYWNDDIASRIVQLKQIRFDNPMFSLTTTFDRQDFTKLLVEQFRVEKEAVDRFFETARGMNFYDDQQMTTRELFEKFFPGREDVIRLLMEPITYANGSTLEDPAITYGIVFSNFMAKGVYIYEGGTDDLVTRMHEELKRNGVDARIRCNVERIVVEKGEIQGVIVNGKKIRCRTVVSNANLVNTIFQLVGATGDLLFSSTAPLFRTEALLSRNITSRTFSFYYPRTRPEGRERRAVVSSTNARWEDWSELGDEEYEASKKDLIETTLDALEKYVPDCREKIDLIDAATPRTFHHYTHHRLGASFGTKFEGLAVSRALPDQVRGLYHAGSVGIIMSGWLGAINYGVIVANEVDGWLANPSSAIHPTPTAG